MRKKAILCLADGSHYEGTMFGACQEVLGELIFHTGASGYQGLLTDPAYLGQIVMLTYPLIGNNGVVISDGEMLKPRLNGLVIQELYEMQENGGSLLSLEAFFENNGATGMCGVDTRAVVRRIREAGVMNAAITEGPVTEELLQRIRSYRVNAPALVASCLEAYGIPGEGPRIAVLDLGGGQALMEALKRLGCAIDVYPAAAIYEEVLCGGCAGAVISNGPGDPKEYPGVCDKIKMLMERIPVLGIGLGHQLMALSQGGDTRKMSVGHRGGNHPVKNLETGMILITAQNHGYVVERDSLPKNAGLLYASINDETVEGLRYPMGISVQFLPEQFPDPRDCDALFREFLSMVEGRN